MDGGQVPDVYMTKEKGSRMEDLNLQKAQDEQLLLES